MTRCRIREARRSDAEALAALAGQLGYPSAPAQVVTRLGGLRDDGEHAILVAETAADAVVGWIHVGVTRRLMVDSFAEVCGLVVDEAHRGQGVGQTLLESAMGWAARGGLRLLRLRSNAVREDAKRFYLKKGFQLKKQQNVLDLDLAPDSAVQGRAIYFAGAIRGGRKDSGWYRDLIRHLSGFGSVLTEHVGENDLDHRGESKLSDREIFRRDTDWLKQADVMIAEVSVPSLGVGFEVAEAARRGMPVLCLYRKGSGKDLSAMIAGNERLSLAIYRRRDEAIKEVDRFMLFTANKPR